MDELTRQVLATLAAVKHIPLESVSPESSLSDLGFDSLDKITLLFELEKRFEISISDQEGGSIHSVGDVVAGVARLMASPTRAED